MVSKNKLLAALSLLVATDDSHWTDDGLPSVQVVRQLASDATVTRGDITRVAPDLTRASVTIPESTGVDEEIVSAQHEDSAAPAVDAVVALRDAPVDALAEVNTTDTKDEDDVVLHDDLPPLEAIEARMVELQGDLEKARKARDDAQAVYAEVSDELDKLTEFREQHYAKEKPADVIRAYLDRQQQNTLARHQRVQALVDSGLAGATVRSPLDMSMMRNKTRGRPA